MCVTDREHPQGANVRFGSKAAACINLRQQAFGHGLGSQREYIGDGARKAVVPAVSPQKDD